MFPVLAERRQQYAASLSGGGEQRMLEIARTLVMDPKRDHARRAVDRARAASGRSGIRRGAPLGRRRQGHPDGRAERQEGARAASDRACVLELGRITLQDRALALLGDQRVARLYMGMAGAT